VGIYFDLDGFPHQVHSKLKLVSGKIEVDPASGELSGLIVVDTASGDSGNRLRDAEMRNNILSTTLSSDHLHSKSMSTDCSNAEQISRSCAWDTKSNHMRLAHSLVTLSEMKGLTYRFFASLRMTVLRGYIIKCTNVLWSDLALHGVKQELVVDSEVLLQGDEVKISGHFVVPYVDWGLKDPSLWRLRVAKQVAINVHTQGHLIWRQSEE
jgi:hypothetical protein